MKLSFERFRSRNVTPTEWVNVIELVGMLDIQMSIGADFVGPTEEDNILPDDSAPTERISDQIEEDQNDEGTCFDGVL